MGMQKKTKVALLLMLISAVMLVGVILLIMLPGNNQPIETGQHAGVTEITITPEPTREPIIDATDPDPVPEEPKGLTNGQRYYTSLVGEGSKNILLIGQDAVYHAYDLIMVISIDEKTKSMKLINFPRDVYIDYNNKILNQLKEADPDKYADNSIQKLNAAHAIAISLKYKSGTGKFGKTTYMNFWADLLDEVFDIPIDDYIIVQTDGFREIVDFFDGVEIDVPLYMHYEDPFQNLYIHLEPGVQVLNGEQAEGFIRFRQGYTKEGEYKSYGVYFRQQNQNKFVKAFFEQHVNISNLGKIGDFTKLILKNVKTNVTNWTDILQYSNIMQKALRGKYSKESVIVECPTNKNIRGIIYEILKTE